MRRCATRGESSRCCLSAATEMPSSLRSIGRNAVAGGAVGRVWGTAAHQCPVQCVRHPAPGHCLTPGAGGGQRRPCRGDGRPSGGPVSVDGSGGALGAGRDAAQPAQPDAAPHGTLLRGAMVHQKSMRLTKKRSAAHAHLTPPPQYDLLRCPSGSASKRARRGLPLFSSPNCLFRHQNTVEGSGTDQVCRAITGWAGRAAAAQLRGCTWQVALRRRLAREDKKSSQSVAIVKLTAA